MLNDRNDCIATIATTQLTHVAGGRVSSRSGSDEQLTLMLSQITSSISAMTTKNQTDPTQLLLLMMMMGGMGGGGGPMMPGPVGPGGAPVINVAASMFGGGRFCRPRRC